MFEIQESGQFFDDERLNIWGAVSIFQEKQLLHLVVPTPFMLFSKRGQN
jgi:hypothetical protein